MILRFSLMAMLMSALSSGAETAADRFQPGRGINLEIWNEWLTADEMVTRPGFLEIYPDWRRLIAPQALGDLKATGFDFVRIPFDPAPLLRLGPGAAQDGLVDQIRLTAELAQRAGLKVIVDLHSIPRPEEAWGTETLPRDPALFEAHVALAGKVAARLHGMDPDRTALELLNEPSGDCDAIFQDRGRELWPEQLQRLHSAARAGAPDLPLVLSGACWGGVDGLERIDPATLADDNVIWSFHSYDPFLFTHQSATWTDGPQAFFADMPFPPEQIDDARAAVLVADALARATAAGATILRPRSPMRWRNTGLREAGSSLMSRCAPPPGPTGTGLAATGCFWANSAPCARPARGVPLPRRLPCRQARGGGGAWHRLGRLGLVGQLRDRQG